MALPPVLFLMPVAWHKQYSLSTCTPILKAILQVNIEGEQVAPLIFSLQSSFSSAYAQAKTLWLLTSQNAHIWYTNII